MPLMTELKGPARFSGSVERVTFHNPDTGYSILKIQTGEDLITVCGNFHSVSEGEYLSIEGEWVIHPKYGRQLKVSSYGKLPLPTLNAVERYLASGFIKGIGPVRAKQIVEKFGVDAIRVLEEEPERLREISGIGRKKIAGLKKSLEGEKAFKETMLALQHFEISPAYALKIYRQYGKNAFQIVKENPYQLAEDIRGIGFLTADRIAARTGIPKDSPFRAESGILYLLEKLSEEGHVYCPYNELLKQTEKQLSIHGEPPLKAIASLFEKRKIVIEEIKDEKAVYLNLLYESETDTARHIKRLSGAKKKGQKRFGTVEDAEISAVQKELGINLSERQAEAVKAALNEKILIITGGPGVGKTTIIKVILKIYKEKLRKEKILLAAPTGRAAKRMSELTGMEAKTIHRLLEYNPREEGFRRNEMNPLEADLVIVDETSMVDIFLMSRLLRAIPDGSSLILVGDTNQLASVGPGSVLKDLIESGIIPTVSLDHIFRQSGESLIVVNAHKINRGEMPVTPKTGNSDFFFIEKEDPEEALQKILELCVKGFPARFGIKNPFREVQVLSPMHKGTAGVLNLNRRLQEILNSRSVKGASVFRAGDKVMQVRNNYEKDVFNGDIGIIRNIHEGEVTVDFEGRQLTYQTFELDELQLSYAASVHKAQGNEYPAVIMPLMTEHFLLLQRNLLYTAVTRAKRLFILVGSRKALAIAVKNSKITNRFSALKERLLKPS